MRLSFLQMGLLDGGRTFTYFGTTSTYLCPPPTTLRFDKLHDDDAEFIYVIIFAFKMQKKSTLVKLKGNEKAYIIFATLPKKESG